jgi:cytosine/adenosine deaminase-related metal-dependent hydrolase
VPAAPGPLLPHPLIVRGHLVTFDDDKVIENGALYIDTGGVIRAVAPATAAPPDGFAQATEVDTGGLVFPGLIDLHNHMAYNCLPLWVAPDRDQPWINRDQWPRDHHYKSDISLPANALCHADAKSVLKYVETKAVIGGVTAIQGSAKLSHPFEGFMVRNVEFETFGTGHKTVNQSVRAFTSAAQCQDAAKDLAEGHAYLYHLCEGTDPKLLTTDYAIVQSHGLLQHRWIGIHSTALGETQFAQWSAAANPGSLVWSPFSNLWLYGQTTDILAAQRSGMRICLGADWSPSGSKSLLGELKVADLHITARGWQADFPPSVICAMATCNPADALGWEGQLGRLKTGLRGDFLVLPDAGRDIYETLIHATESDIALVAINGYPMYGTDALMRAANAVDPEPIQVSPTLSRSVQLVDERIPDADVHWPQVIASLQAARKNPLEAREQALQRDGVTAPTVTLLPDKPWDDLEAPENAQLLAAVADAQIPELDALIPNDAYFAAIAAEKLHGGQLGGLRAYYPST